MTNFHLLFLGNPNLPRDIFAYLEKVDGLRITSFQSKTDKAISLSRAPVRTICTDFNDTEETLALARAVHALDPFDAVMVIYELFTPLAGLIRDELGLCGPSAHSVQAARDKLVTRDILTRAGLSEVPYAKIGSARELEDFMLNLGGPVVLKPINGVASRCVFFLNDPDEAAATWAEAERDLEDPEWLGVSREGRLSGYMAEGCIDGREYSVEAVTHDRHTHVIAVVEKRLQGAIESGHAVPARSLSEEQVIQVQEYVKDVLAAIEVDSSISHTELKWSARGPEVVEINLRLAGDSIPRVVEAAYGSDIIEDYLQLLVHRRAPRRRRAGAAGIRFFLPEFCQIEAVKQVEQAAELAGVDAVVIEAAPGKTIRRIRNSRDRAGFAIARGATAEETRERLDRVFATVQFVTRPLDEAHAPASTPLAGASDLQVAQ